MTLGDAIPLAVLAAAALACDGQQPELCLPASPTPAECVEMLGPVASQDSIAACQAVLGLEAEIAALTARVDALCAASPGVCPT